ncbi:MAG TPA: AAA family ATPase [Actinomycetota bacterium]|nr:AAA family ATPase [Actinomycetota bacterium]
MTGPRRSEVALYQRNARHVTDRRVLHEIEKGEAIAALPWWKRRAGRAEHERDWAEQETVAAAAAEPALARLRDAATEFDSALRRLAALDSAELRAKVEPEIQRVAAVSTDLSEALAALERRDFGAAGAAADRAGRELWLVGGPLVVALNEALGRATIGRAQRDALLDNISERQRAKAALEQARLAGPAASMEAAATVHLVEAAGLRLAAEVLAVQAQPKQAPARSAGSSGPAIVPPHELETFDDVAGLHEVKEQLRATVGTILENPDEAARYRLVHNGILFYGPPGTGKTLLSRALAGEYGLRYLRVTPATIGSPLAHETAANVQRVFDLAIASAPCLLFLDEVDSLAGARDEAPGSEHREVVTQLMTSLETCRSTPGLLVCAATNDVDRLDPGLREGRFDARIRVPLPDREARREIVLLHLKKRTDSVDWDAVDVDAVVDATGGRNAAALEQIVTLAAQAALASSRPISGSDLLTAVRHGSGRDRAVLEERVTWDDVVLPDDTREQLMDLVNVFVKPDLARSLGIEPPPGILLHGPPGTGKTTIARAMASEIDASFYEHSAADLLSKWAGESEQRVAKLFAKARANRPSIIFVDEIDGLLRARGGDSANRWEERVVSQFLRELDGLATGGGVLLVGATNRPDVVDPAVRERRLAPVEIGLPDAAGRLQLLRRLLASASVAPDVDLRELALATEGMSGADLKRLRDLAGMKTLTRASREGTGAANVRIASEDLTVALQGMRRRASLAVV